ncbi:hypothetical protein MRX96_006912 [Rhipicephalus microplus]
MPATTIREVALLRELKHENIVRLLEVLMPPSKAVHLVFEYMAMDLRALFDPHGKNRTFDDAVVKRYLRQTVAAIILCHQRRVLHRGLKPANLLVDGNGNLKFTDIGLFRSFTPPVGISTHKVVTLWYRALEMLLGSSRYSTPVDVWRIGSKTTRRPFPYGERTSWPRCFLGWTVGLDLLLKMLIYSLDERI